MVNVYKMWGVFFILVFPLLFLGANGQIQPGDSTTITSEDDMTTTTEPITTTSDVFTTATDSSSTTFDTTTITSATTGCEYMGKHYDDGDLIGPIVIIHDCTGCQQKKCLGGVVLLVDIPNCFILCCFFNGALYPPGSVIQNACAKFVCDGITGQFIYQGFDEQCCEYMGKHYDDGDLIGPIVIRHDCTGCQQLICLGGVVQLVDIPNCFILCCFFNGSSYHPGSVIQKVCAKLVCDGNTGQFIDHGIDRKCRVCTAYLDPHIVTYARKSYAYQGCGNHSLSQIGSSYQPTLAIYATFKSCDTTVSCVDSATFKNDEHTIITMVGSNPGQIQVNGDAYTVPSSSPSIVRVLNTEYPVLAWWGNKQTVHLQGSSGILVLFIWSSVNSVRVWANSDVAGGLTGLCGTVNDDANDYYTTRDGIIISPLTYTPPDDFTISWLASNTNNADCTGIGRVKRQAQNNCETDSSVQDDFYRKCNTTVWNGYPDADPEEAQIIIDDCFYDLCHVSDPDAWLGAVEEETQAEADIQEKTINCFWLGEFYPQNTTRPGECGEETCEAGSWVLIDNSTSTCISDFTTTTTATTMATTTLAPTTFEKTTTTSTVPTTVEPSTTTPITNIGTTANNEVPPQIVLPAPPIEKNMNLKIQILQIVN